jgi:hypothetical protein
MSHSILNTGNSNFLVDVSESCQYKHENDVPGGNWKKKKKKKKKGQSTTSISVDSGILQSTMSYDKLFPN